MVKNLLLELGYKESDINIIVDSYSLSALTDEGLVRKIKDIFAYLLEVGYSKESIIKMTKSLPSLYSYSIDRIDNKIKFMVLLGYTKEEVIKITKIFPQIYCYSIDNMKCKIQNMILLGYTKDEIINMTKKIPSIYSFSIGYIKQRIEDLVLLGYTREDVMMMTKNLPSLLCYSIDNIKGKIDDMILLGYTKEEVLKMTRDLPTIYGLNIDNLKKKIDYYDSINLHQVVVDIPKYLMQSVALSYARYEFYKDKGIEINRANYKRLFMNQKKFEKQYGIKKEELLELYSYNTEDRNMCKRIKEI